MESMFSVILCSYVNRSQKDIAELAGVVEYINCTSVEG